MRESDGKEHEQNDEPTRRVKKSVHSIFQKKDGSTCKPPRFEFLWANYTGKTREYKICAYCACVPFERNKEKGEVKFHPSLLIAHSAATLGLQLVSDHVSVKFAS